MVSALNPQFKQPIVLFGNGEIPSHSIELNTLKNASTILCADGAVDKLLSLEFIPDLILGDLDSLSRNPSDYSCDFIHLPDQSKNDLEKSLEWCCEKNIEKLSLVGFSGKRDDHNMATLFLLAEYSEKMDLILYTNHSTIVCINGQREFDSLAGQKISMISLLPPTIITTDGLKFPIKDTSLDSTTRGISNIAKGSRFSINANGPVWVFLNHTE